MSGFLALGVSAYFIWRANQAMDEGEDGRAVLYLLAGMASLFVLGTIFL